MSLTVAQMRTRVARVSGMSLSATADAALIDGWYNDAVEQFLIETKANVRPAVLSVTAGQGDYSLDTDILAMAALWYAPASAASSMLIPVAPEDLYAMRFAESTNGPPVYYALQGAHSILIHPEPASSSDSIHMLYVPRHTALSATSDSPAATANGNIPAEFHVVLEAYVTWKACEAEEHRASENGAKYAEQWVAGIMRAKTELRRKAGTVLPDIRVGRRRRPIVGNGVDLG